MLTRKASFLQSEFEKIKSTSGELYSLAWLGGRFKQNEFKKKIACVFFKAITLLKNLLYFVSREFE